ncbi:DUF7674 family protein [Yersinia similis]|uniref:DUF7674 family protein n=1 Tax=Yersinia similis TaxID=367190 RepID=UPI00119CC948|nr:hypothetical protein [Yersinia similis]
MDKYFNDYIFVFTQLSEYVKKEVDQCVEYWLPESPPMILLFSRIGKVLVNQFSELNEAEKYVISQHIEDGMQSDNDELATAVATGLIESLVTATDENEELWKAIEAWLHIESRKHAIAWKNFGQ